MENDLSKCKVGDLLATLYGWKRISEIDSDDEVYPINLGCYTFTKDGRYQKEHIAPSAFIDPPDWLLEYIGPRPCQFKKDELVIVWDENTEKCPTFLEYFCRMEGNNYLCYQHGRTSATSQGKVNVWTHCRKAIAGEDY